MTDAATASLPRVGSRAARLANRLARGVPVAPTRFAPRAGLVSFTFDDAPLCAATRGADLLAAHGGRGTYYVAGALVGTRSAHWRHLDAADVARLHADGHEIGCHTHSHAFLPDLRGGAVAEEIARNAACLRALLPGAAPESFAYPFGFGTLSAKRLLARTFRSARGIRPGLNLGLGDAAYLRANPLIDGAMDEAGLARLMDAAAARAGWLVFYGHDVARDPSAYGCRPALLESALRMAVQRGMACVTVAEGLRRARAVRDETSLDAGAASAAIREPGVRPGFAAPGFGRPVSLWPGLAWPAASWLTSAWSASWLGPT